MKDPYKQVIIIRLTFWRYQLTGEVGVQFVAIVERSGNTDGNFGALLSVDELSDPQSVVVFPSITCSNALSVQGEFNGIGNSKELPPSPASPASPEKDN